MVSVRISIDKDELVINLVSYVSQASSKNMEYGKEIKTKPVVKVKQDKLIVCLRTEIPLRNHTYKIEVDK